MMSCVSALAEFTYLGIVSVSEIVIVAEMELFSFFNLLIKTI